MAKKNIEIPNIEEEKKLNAIAENSSDEITLRGRKWRIKWIRNGTKRKVTDIILTEKEELKVGAKCVAALLLNSFWKIWLFYGLLWRWFYYVEEYSDAELRDVVSQCKKKLQAEDYCVLTILLNDMKDTVMMMTREEAERIRRGLSSGRHGTSGKNTES